MFKFSPWKFIEDEVGEVEEWHLETGIVYLVTARLAPKSKMRILDGYGNARILAEAYEGIKGYPVRITFTFDRSWGECAAVQYQGQISNVEFTIHGVDFSDFGKGK